MFKALYGKLAAVLLGLLCLTGVGYVLLTLFTTRMYLQEISQKLNRTLAEHMVSEKIPLKEGRVNEEAMKELLHMLMVINPSIEIYLLDPTGTIVAYSAPPGKVKRQTVALEPINRFLSKTATFPIAGDDPRDTHRKKVFSAAPIVVGNQVQGYLYVILGGEEYDSVAQMLQGSYILRLSLGIVVASLLLAFVSGLLVFNLMTRRLRRLASAMEGFRQSDFLQHRAVPTRPDISRTDEIDQLGITFHQMAERIIEQMKQLKQTDAQRRELVANVSHDLRTPLASLQGYLDTLLLKEGTLTPEEQRHYLAIAARHSERLGKLVGELFELARLDSRETQPHREPFSLGELVQDIVKKFQLVADIKKITIHTSFRKDLPFVLADIGLIERVLENLIDNALRYTPAGGTVTVGLDSQDDMIKVEMTDSGCGIPQEDLPYIFDRFYRVDKNDQEKSAGAGLGLAIAKRILELHGSSIESHSTLNVGTTFTFHLPLHT